MTAKKMFVLLCAVVMLAGCAAPEELSQEIPALAFREYAVGKLDALPSYDPDDHDAFQVDLRGGDLRDLDIADRGEDLLRSVFNTRTQWPDVLPEGFDPALMMELGKDPGLGVRSLHERGFTGEGVSIAIIDQPLGTMHEEYKDNVVYYQDFAVYALDQRDFASMHGCAVASLAVGKDIGVAPGAKLYYFSDFLLNEGGELSFLGIAKALDRIVEINKSLPKAERIRSVSIARGFSGGIDGYTEVMAAIRRAEESGVFVITTSMGTDSGYEFVGMDRDPMSDPNDLSGYTIPYWWGEGDQRTVAVTRASLAFPMGSRTYAACTGAQEYEFSAAGGYSWVVPYINGLYAIAVQVKPDITPREFWDLAMQTCDPASAEVRNYTYTLNVVDPIAIVEALLGE